MFENRPALLLNADYRPVSYFPLSLWNWEHAVKAVFEKTVDVVAEYDDVVARSPSIEIPLPSVIALKRYVPAPKYVAFTRFNVFLRDSFKCQYCGCKFKSSDLTFDHVIPRAHGGLTTWENITTACIECNAAKDSKLTKPRVMPYKPTPGQLFAAQKEFPPRILHKSWNDFLYWGSELEE